MKKKTLASLLALTMVAGSLSACGKTTTETPAAPQATEEASTEAAAETETTEEAETELVSTADLPSSVQELNGKEYGENADYISLYDKYGKQISIADVTEDETTGLAYLNVDGKKFVVCDPTYIGAPIGATMPEMDNSTAKVILLSNLR